MKTVLLKLVVTLFLLSGTLAAIAGGESVKEPNQYISGFYLQVGIGHNDPAYQIDDFYHVVASSIQSPTFSEQATLGYDITQRIATQINIIYTTPNSVLLNGVRKRNFYNNLVSWTVLYSIPLSDRLALSAIGGLGYVARSRVSTAGKSVLPGGNTVVPVYGAKLQYRVLHRLTLFLNWLGAPKRSDVRLPSTNYFGGGIGLRFGHICHSASHDTFKSYQGDNMPPKHTMMFGFYDRNFWSPDIKRPPPPIMWTAATKAAHGATAEYLYNIFNTKHVLSLYAGLAASWWERQSKSLFVASGFLEFRFWLWRHGWAKPFVTWSIAGPSLMSNYRFGNTNLGGHFIWRDTLGVGVTLGQEQQLDITVRVQHYSNGDFLAKNPGMDVPIVITVGYAFG